MTKLELVWNPITIAFIIAYQLAICLYFYGSRNHPTPQLWLDNILKNCDDVDLHVDPEL